MRVLGLWVALSACPLLAGDNPVVVYARFDHELDPAIAMELQGEVGAIMAPAGYKIEWRSIANMRRGEVVDELVVVTFRGRCDPTGTALLLSPRGALGWTHVSDGVVLPFSEVDCDRVYSLMSTKIRHFGAQRRRTVFGRAVGRVIAHELYHIFSHAAQHGTSGVAKPVYTVNELLADEFRFADKEAVLLLRNPATN